MSISYDIDLEPTNAASQVVGLMTPFMPLNPQAGFAYFFDYNYSQFTPLGNISGEGRVIWRISDVAATSPNGIDGSIRIEGRAVGSTSGTGFFDVDSEVSTSEFEYFYKSGVGEVRLFDSEIIVGSEGTEEEERIWELLDQPGGDV
ncbi:MAG: hypothetical protein EA402_07200 [Planctomycetota bacterium]|nr:MAG: hypothetical protein EA402_07200 [Planctomycetota bacterium]